MLIKSFINFHGSLWILKSLSQHSVTNFKGGIFSSDLRGVNESAEQLSGMCLCQGQAVLKLGMFLKTWMVGIS